VVAQAKTEAGKKVEARATAPLLRYTPQTRFTLPFSGTWWVAGGHEPVADVPHRLGPSQEFAYDFLQLGSEGRSFRTEGQTNEDYYAYGQPILAAAAGTVVAALDGIPENRPGEVPATEDMIREVNLALGNHVILDHGHQEYTFYAHLQTGSVSVQAGEPVRQGKILGRCGNSGHSTEPHLHFHLMDGPQVLASLGLPLVFHDYFRGDTLVEQGTLCVREFVSATPCATSGRSSTVAKVLIPFSVRNDTLGVRRSLPPPAQKQRLLHSRGDHF
jgi:murein DD-endopeptidase MepM/ murein hydrolase activator NlpD